MRAPVFWRAHGVRERAICKPARKQHPSSTQAAPKQQQTSTKAAPSSTPAAPTQHPSSTNEGAPGGTNIGFARVQGCIY
eukprot:9340625-Lingulodinium_polyedra.AAC.1